MKKQVASYTKKELQERGGASWVIIAISAVAIVLAINLFGSTHHWMLALIIAIIGILGAGITDKSRKKRR